MFEDSQYDIDDQRVLQFFRSPLRRGDGQVPDEVEGERGQNASAMFVAGPATATRAKFSRQLKRISVLMDSVVRVS